MSIKIEKVEGEKFEGLKKIFEKKLADGFKNNTEESFQEYFQEIKSELNKIYNKIYEKDLGLVEGYNLEEHTEMVIHQFSKFYKQFKGKFSGIMNEENFIQMLTIHDIGKVMDSVQELKEQKVEKKIWKEEEKKQTKVLVDEILGSVKGFDNIKKEIILEILTEGSSSIGNLVNERETPEDVADYIVSKSNELKIDNPIEYFNILETYFLCDAGAYTVEILEDFKDSMDEEKYQSILEKYKKGLEGERGDGFGITKIFHQDSNTIRFANSNAGGREKKSYDAVLRVREILSNDL